MSRRKVLCPYKPRSWAIPFHQTTKRWMVLVVHRRAGKTTAALNFLQRSALTKNKSTYAYIAPTYKMAKGIAWSLLKEASRFVRGVKHMESELMVIYPNGSRITLYGAENPDRLRGIGLYGVVFDEYGMQPSNIFSEVIRPTLIEHGGYAIWIGTPKGKNEFYRLYEKHKDDAEWFVRHLTVDDTGIIAKDEIENSRKTMSHEEWLQEFYCSFDSAVKGAVYGTELHQARTENRVGTVPLQREYPVFTVWDLGVGPNLAIGFYQKINNQVHMIDYWQGTHNDGIDVGINIVNSRGYNYGKHFAPHDMKQREITTGKTRIDYARDLGIDFRVIDNELMVNDGLQMGKFLFSRLWIDENRCERWLDAMGQYRWQWDEKRSAFDQKPYKDWTSHAADVHRYAALIEHEMVVFSQNESVQFEIPNFDPYY